MTFFCNLLKLWKLIVRYITNPDDRQEVINTFYRKLMPNVIATELYEERYRKKIRKIKKRRGNIPVKVLFFVSQNQKWACDSLYWAMENDPSFDPYILISPSVVYGNDEFYEILEQNLSFFKEKGMKTLLAYDLKKKRYINLKKFTPDIVFYQQQHEIPPVQDLSIVSRFSLTCWVPYSLMVGNYQHDWDLPFQHNMWKIFLDSEDNKKRFEKLMSNKARNCYVSGYPKMDFFLDNKKDNSHEKIVIYAPHHSFEPHGQRFATFQWNGQFILDYARQHKDIHFILKPHPRFKFALQENKIMSSDEVDSYYNEWSLLDNCEIYEKGDYLDLFIKSSLMVTDCASFLAEYSFTSNPLIHLWSNESKGYNLLGEKIIQNYYRVENVTQLQSVLDNILILEHDELKEKRLSQKSLFIPNGGSGNAIRAFLKKELLGVSDGV